MSLEDQLIAFSTAFVKPSDDPELKPHHEYRLRGAVVSKETLFALEEATHTEKRVASSLGSGYGGDFTTTAIDQVLYLARFVIRSASHPDFISREPGLISVEAYANCKNTDRPRN